MAELRLRVSGIRVLTPAIKAFVLEAEDGGALPPWEAGAHVDVILPNGLRRSYSLANDPAERDRYLTAVLREETGGGGSKWMHDSLAVGDVLTVTEPANNFPLAPDAARHLLIAGGIGITPILAMGRALAARGADFFLHYCTKSPEETAFLEEVKEVFGPRVRFHHDGGDIAKGIRLGEVLSAPEPGTHLYVCGPAGLLNAARAAATHWPEGAVHFELFTSARSEDERREVAARPAGEFEIVLARSNLRLTVPADKSIIEVLWENDISVPYACEDGWCGNCTVGLLGGEVDHRDEVLSEGERKTKLQVCVSRAKPEERTLVLDL